MKSLSIIQNNHVFYLLLIAFTALLLRLYYFPYNIPLSLDALLYFWFATDTSALGYIPSGYSFPNNLWPLVLAGFFSVIKFASWIDYMDFQRMLTVSISVLTIIPLYFLLRKYFEYPYPIIGVALFALEPRIIQNSLSGLTDPLFIFLGISTLVLFLNDRMSLVYASFATLGLFSLTRYEGLLLFVPLTIMFFIRFRNKKAIIRYIIAFSVFVLVLIPMAYIRIQTTGQDGLTSHLFAGAKIASENIGTTGESVKKFSLFDGIYGFSKLIVWSTFPTYFLFIIPGIYFLFKNKNYKSYVIILACIVLLLPALYAASRGIEETRYFLMAFVFFSLASVLTIRKIVEKVRNKKTALFLTLSLIIISAIFFLNWKIDNQHERESIKIAEEVAKRTIVINDYHPESVYLRTVGFNDYQDFSGKRLIIHNKITILFAEKFNSLNEFLKYGKSQGLEYLIVDDHIDRPQFLTEIFTNEEDYSYLVKDFDSAEIDFKYHVKIFKIDYELLDFES